MHGLRVLAALPVIALCLVACGPTPDQINNSGHEPYTSAEYETALDAYETARDRAPKSGVPLYNAGNALYRMEEYDESLEEYDEALKHARGDLRSRGFFNRGNAAFQRQRYAEAVESYKEVLRMNPGDLDAKHNLELALRQLPPESQDEEQTPPQAQPPQSQPPPQTQPPPPEPQTEPLTGEQARQALEAVGEDAQTLQERREQTLVSPKPPPEFDW